MTRILALSPIPEEGAGCRFRGSKILPWLERAGYTLDDHTVDLILADPVPAARAEVPAGEAR